MFREWKEAICSDILTDTISIAAQGIDAFHLWKRKESLQLRQINIQRDINHVYEGSKSLLSLFTLIRSPASAPSAKRKKGKKVLRSDK